jgi:hypothetical protein
MEADRKASAEKDAAARRTSDGRSVVAEVYPALWSHRLARADRTEDQHDAYSIAGWLSRADRDGSLAAFLKPGLTPLERAAWWRSRDGSWEWRNACGRRKSAARLTLAVMIEW